MRPEINQGGGSDTSHCSPFPRCVRGLRGGRTSVQKAMIPFKRLTPVLEKLTPLPGLLNQTPRRATAQAGHTRESPDNMHHMCSNMHWRRTSHPGLLNPAKGNSSSGPHSGIPRQHALYVLKHALETYKSSGIT